MELRRLSLVQTPSAQRLPTQNLNAVCLVCPWVCDASLLHSQQQPLTSCIALGQPPRLLGVPPSDRSVRPVSQHRPDPRTTAETGARVMSKALAFLRPPLLKGRRSGGVIHHLITYYRVLTSSGTTFSQSCSSEMSKPNKEEGHAE